MRLDWASFRKRDLGECSETYSDRVNQDFAAAADEVYLLVAGLPLQLKPTA